MNAVPIIENPKVEEIFKFREKIPCFDVLEKIVTEELAMGNQMLCIGDAGFAPSETVVIIDFATEPKVDYEELKVCKLKSGCEYKYLTFCDNKGALEFDFCRI